MSETLYYIVANAHNLFVIHWDGKEVEIEGGPSGRPAHQFETELAAAEAADAANHCGSWPGGYEVYRVTRGGRRKV